MPGHRVGGELPTAGAGPRARGRLELVELGVAHLPGRVGADRPRRRRRSRPRAAGTGPVRSSPCRTRPPGCRAGRSPSRCRGSSCRSAQSCTSPSKRWPRQTSSIESAITSRETSDARIPEVPIETPSETATVLNSIGVPPASRMPRFTCTARSRWLRLHGIVSIHVVPDAHDRLREVLVGEAGALEHRPRPCAVGAVGERGADALRGIGGEVVRGAHGAVLLSMGCPSRRHHSLNDPGYILTSLASGEHEPLRDDAGRDAGAAVRDELGRRRAGRRAAAPRSQALRAPGMRPATGSSGSTSPRQRSGERASSRTRPGSPRRERISSALDHVVGAWGDGQRRRPAAVSRGSVIEQARRRRAGRTCRRASCPTWRSSHQQRAAQPEPSSQARTKVSASTPRAPNTAASRSTEGSGWRPPPGRVDHRVAQIALRLDVQRARRTCPPRRPPPGGSRGRASSQRAVRRHRELEHVVVGEAVAQGCRADGNVVGPDDHRRAGAGERRAADSWRRPRRGSRRAPPTGGTARAACLSAPPRRARHPRKRGGGEQTRPAPRCGGVGVRDTRTGACRARPRSRCARAAPPRPARAGASARSGPGSPSHASVIPPSSAAARLSPWLSSRQTCAQQLARRRVRRGCDESERDRCGGRAEAALERDPVHEAEALPGRVGEQREGADREVGRVLRQLPRALALDDDSFPLGHLELVPEVERGGGAVEGRPEVRGCRRGASDHHGPLARRAQRLR